MKKRVVYSVRRFKNSERLPPLLLILIWILLVATLKPIGNFPLNDDWSYAQATYNLVEEGKLLFTGWTAVPLISQVLWGAIFCLPFGFSFNALRISTLVLSLVGILSIYFVLKETNVRPSVAFFSALVLAFNPLFFVLSMSFMTDVPFLSFCTLSFLFFIRGIKGERRKDFILGTCFAIVATFIRQLGILIPLSFGVSYLLIKLSEKKVSKNTIFWGLLPPFITIGLLIAYNAWLQLTNRIPHIYNLMKDPILNRLDEASTYIVLVTRSLDALLYMGLFLFPFLLFIYRPERISSPFEKKMSLVCSFLFSAVFIGYLLLTGKLMPLAKNVFFDFGLGPPTLRDEFILNLSHFPTAPRIIWLLITITSVIGGALILTTVLLGIIRLVQKQNKAYNNKKRTIFIFLITTVALYLITIGLTAHRDRYLVFLLPPLFVIILLSYNPMSDYPIKKSGNRATQTFSIACLLAFGLLSFSATHDYLSWNRSRWEAIRYLMDTHNVSYKNIDGGFEFNGWYGYSDKYKFDSIKSWWWVYDDEYIISFGPIDGYKIVNKFIFKRMIPYGKGNIYILRREKKN